MTRRGTEETAIRGGYGIFFEHTNGNEAVATALEGSAPFVLNPIQNNIPTTFDTNGNIVSSGYAGVGGSLGLQFAQSLVSIPQKQVWPYVQQWHMDVQPGCFRRTAWTHLRRCRRNIVRNPRTSNADMALFKHFPIMESVV